MSIAWKLLDAVPKDYPAIVEVWEASVRATHDFVTEEDILFFRPLVRDGLPRTDQLLCARAADNSLTGFIGVTGRKIEMLFVHPDWRGKGVGRCLLEHAVSVLGASDVDVNEQNEQAVAFYRRMGFVVVGRSDLDGTGKPYPILQMRLRIYISRPQEQAGTL